jgi:transcription termination/antitermination protein NusA
MDTILDLLGLGPTEELRVVTGHVTSANGDVAMVRTSDGLVAMLPSSEFYSTRVLRVGDSYQLLLLGTDPAAVVSAVRPELVTALYEGIAPELRSGAVRIISVARAAGVRSKVAVAATQPGVDPVAALVGREANRVKAVSALLGGERLEIIPYHPVPEVYLANALAPAAVERVEIVGDTATAYTPAHQMSAAVGALGLNSQLAGQLLGLGVRIEPMA